MARTQAQRARRQRLLDAARRAVIVHGAEVRLTQVAEQAGLTSGAVLYHYPDLQALLVEANEAGMDRFYGERVAAVEGVDDPAAKLVLTVRSGLPADRDDDGVRLLCELGGAASRHRVYGELLTELFDRQVEMYLEILRSGARSGTFTLAQDPLTVARNLVALEDAYGYRMMADHPQIDRDVAARLVLDYARLATGHPLPDPPDRPTTR